MVELDANQHEFSKQYCRQITWAVLKDSRKFFSQVMSKEKFLFGMQHGTLTLKFPDTTLHLTVVAAMSCLHPLDAHDFPEKF